MTELALEDPDEIIAAVRGVRSAQTSPESTG
jgi:hypothetical protein